MIQKVLGSRGCATSGKPNWLGRPLGVRSVQVSPPSVERYIPQWFCWYSVSGSPGGGRELVDALAGDGVRVRVEVGPDALVAWFPGRATVPRLEDADRRDPDPG